MRQLPLTKGYFTLVDDEDYIWLLQWKWQACPKAAGYTTAHRLTARDCNGKRKNIQMHVAIMQHHGFQTDGLEVDHLDRNPLNNQTDNLRMSTKSQNHGNLVSSIGTSRFKGVSWHSVGKKWRAAIKYNRKFFHLGLFHSEEEAARVYDKKAKELFGDFARTNFDEVNS